MTRRRISRFTRAEGDDSASVIDLTPLIDMVFILLIFFLVTSSFIRESAIEVQRPKAATAMLAKDAKATVTIAADGQIWLNDASVDIRLLRSRIEQLGLGGANGSAVILADTATPTGLLVKTMDQIRLAGITSISVAASSDAERP